MLLIRKLIDCPIRYFCPELIIFGPFLVIQIVINHKIMPKSTKNDASDPFLDDWLRSKGQNATNESYL